MDRLSDLLMARLERGLRSSPLRLGRQCDDECGLVDHVASLRGGGPGQGGEKYLDHYLEAITVRDRLIAAG